MPPEHAIESESTVVSPEDVDACLRVLARLGDEPLLATEVPLLGEAVARAYKRVRKERRRKTEVAARLRDRAAVENTGRCRADPLTVSTPALTSSGGGAELTKSRRCYVCRSDYRHLH